MSYTLGIDLGTNSLGFALIQKTKILETGATIFSYNLKGEEERRIFRNKRVQFKRRKQRKKQLKRELNSLGINFEPNSNTFELRKESLNSQLNLSNLGNVIYSLNQKRGFKSNRKIKIEDQVENRDLIQNEFNSILNFQSQFYPNLLTKETKDKLQKIIFYQRPLKSQKHLKGKCTFEKRKFRAPKCSLLSQEFRMLCDLNNLKIWDQSGEIVNFNRELLIDYLKVNSSLNLTKSDFKRGGKIILNSKIVKLLNLDKFQVYYSNLEKLNGNSSLAQLNKIIDLSLYSEDQIEKIVHSLSIFQEEQLLKEYSKKTWNYSEEQSTNYSKLQLESGYLNFSTRAIKRIIPFLRQGMIYSSACEAAGYNHSEPNEIKESYLLSYFPKTNNSVVDKSLNQLRLKVNELILKYGKPEIIRVELSSDLKNSKKKREEIYFRNLNNERENKRIIDLLKSEFNIQNPNNQDILKYKLWKEQNQNCIYTGKEISRNELFSNSIEIDHIIPYSRSLDNSFTNLTLTFRNINQDKSNRTPFEYLGNDFDFRERVKTLPKFKQFKFTQTEIKEDFIERQLQDTQYISRLASQYLKSVCKNVQISKGKFTSELRSNWNLNSILNLEGNFKNREDHRHHAVDAIVVALTSPQMLKERSSNYSQTKFELSWSSFYEDVEKSISQIIVQHKVNKKKQGKLHEETLYSQMKERFSDKPLLDKEYKDGSMKFYSIKKPLNYFNLLIRIKNVVDKTLKEVLTQQFNKFGLIKEPLRIPSKKGKFELEIKSIRIKVKSSKAFNIKGNRIVENSLNYCYNIFEDKNGKRSGKIVSLFESSQKGFELPKDENYLCSIFKNDLWYFGNKEEEFDVEKVFRVTRITEGLIRFQKSYLNNNSEICASVSKLKGFKIYRNFLLV